jgi:hypothetical protein
MRPLLLTVCALALSIPSVSLAEGCTPSSSYPELDTGDPLHSGAGTGRAAPRLYGDADLCTPYYTCADTFWVYLESNGMDGLQRDDELIDDTCDGQIDGDTLIF